MPQATGTAIGIIRPNGKKIGEAAGYLKSSRVCVLTWVREMVLANDNLNENVDEISEMLDVAQRLEDIRAKLDVRASVLGR